MKTPVRRAGRERGAKWRGGSLLGSFPSQPPYPHEIGFTTARDRGRFSEKEAVSKWRQLESFRERVSGSGDTGALDGPAFLAALPEWVLGAYTAAFERIEQRLEEFDVQPMRGNVAEEDVEQLVALRRSVGVLRRALAAHRSAVVALTHPELEALGTDASGERFVSSLRRFEATVQEARDAREAIVGSFDVLIARTAHDTNRVMKVLTLTSVLLLSGTLIAGVMGMNFNVHFFQVSWLFYIVLGAMALIALTTLGVARHRTWI